MQKTDKIISKSNLQNKTAEFISVCRVRYGVNMECCDNNKGIYHAELRNACAVNSCGNFGKCHTCPPNIGSAEKCINKALSYSKIAVFQKIFPLEDSYDFYGMVEAQKQFHTVQHSIAELAKETFENPFILGAGGCLLCVKCAAKDGLPCRFPEKAISSLEAYCIQVSELSDICGMKYINGPDTVTYFGGVFLK